MQEAGIGNFDISAVAGRARPRRTPRRSSIALNAELVRAMRSADVRERIVTQGGTKSDKHGRKTSPR